MRKAIFIVISIAALALLIIGTLHVLVTLTSQGIALTVDAVWFASFGLMLMFVAFLNYILMASTLKSTILFVPGHVANLLTTLLVTALMIRAFYPHIILIFVLLVVETILLLYTHLTARQSTV